MKRCLAVSLWWVICTFVLLGCAAGGSSDGGAAASPQTRPTTPARLQFVSPAPEARMPSSFTMTLDLTGAQVTAVTSGAITRDEGHIHVSLDGSLISMTYGTKQDLTGLAPGLHTLQAEFVAKDHAPFANRPRAFVRFTVR